MSYFSYVLRILKKCYTIPSSIVQNFIRTVYAQNMYISQVNVVTTTHKETFGEFKNKHNGQDIVLIATGPSLNKYKKIENTINIGVNKAIFNKDLKFDYYFTIDHAINEDYIEKLIEYKDTEKFYGQLQPSHYGLKELKTGKGIMPESLILKHNARKYFLYSKTPTLPVYFNPDIDKTWLADGGSCIFSAAQFALFTNPKRIYLVGCDCSTGYFDDGKKSKIKLKKSLIKAWIEFRQFANTYYPDTEIISVNPVGLRGIFKDLYQNEE